MGKGEENSVAEPDDKSDNNEELKTEEVEEDEPTTEQKTEKPEPKQEEEQKDKQEPKKNVDELRKVIKVNNDDESDKKTEENTEDADLESNTRENLEQKRAILQNIKDFDFQIKKNQEEITGINKKLDSVSKDLDDLVSLYEIVSEQMNPFVGLSKVTKKRIDALENFTKEIDDLKNRMGDIESFAVKAGADLQTYRENRQDSDKDEDPIDEKIEQKMQQQKPTQKPINNNLDQDDLDYIIEKSLNTLSIDKQIDITIDEFIENLLHENIN